MSCVLGIVVQLRCFLVPFGASLCIWSAVESIENIVSPEGGFLLARESGWRPYVYARHKRALLSAHIHRVLSVRRACGWNAPSAGWARVRASCASASRAVAEGLRVVVVVEDVQHV